ncbi:T9SS type A sorting domain-containing protein [Saccharicrinis sp. FJH54]|uniref:T9SS type A sorting domain-containing protein n=1 Tax=Saccharicrinis sp. FJH54 TaxID=3344665 RepID=UPI0035D3DC8C
MKYVYSLLAALFFQLTLICAQVQLTEHSDFTAGCIETSFDYTNQGIAYTHNDSVILDLYWSEQCCANFSLKINAEPNDTIFMELTDTAEAQCDCMCRFEIRINAGQKVIGTETVNLNGKNYRILDEDYKPLVQIGKSWNVMKLIPGLEHTYFNTLKYTIKTGEGHFFCWNGISYVKVTTTLVSVSDSGFNDTIPHYIREENGKVYLLDSTDLAFDGCNECLLYDFTAKQGEIVYLGYDSIPFEVNEKGIDEITGRRFWILSDLSNPYPSESATSILPPPTTKWIEGIGDVRGLLESKKSLFIDGAYTRLACCKLQDNVLYQNPEFPDCGERPPYNFLLEMNKKWTFVSTCTNYPDTIYQLFNTIIDASNLTVNPYAMRFSPEPDNNEIYYQEENGRVYYNDENGKILIYDFTLNQGDSVIVAPITHAYLYVDSVTYIQYADDAVRKTLYLSGYTGMNGSENRIWIEGIGDPYAPLSYWMPLATAGNCTTEFTCCSRNDMLIYSNPAYPDCGLHLATRQVQQQSITVFPNPTNGKVILEYAADVENADYAVYTASGKLVQTGKIQKTLQFYLEDGVYLLTVSLSTNYMYRNIILINTRY